MWLKVPLGKLLVKGGDKYANMLVWDWGGFELYEVVSQGFFLRVGV